MIELLRFELREGVDENAFLAADARLQSDFAYQQPGLARRTLAHGDKGWLVIDVWRSAADAEACSGRWDADPVVAEFMAYVEPTSVSSESYETF